MKKKTPDLFAAGFCHQRLYMQQEIDNSFFFPIFKNNSSQGNVGCIFFFFLNIQIQSS